MGSEKKDKMLAEKSKISPQILPCCTWYDFDNPMST